MASIINSPMPLSLSVQFDLLTRVRNKAASYRAQTDKSLTTLIVGKAEWEELVEFAANNWAVHIKSWQLNRLAGIHIKYEEKLPYGLYTIEDAEQALSILAAESGETGDFNSKKEGE